MIIKAYIDESGVGDETHCTVAAFVGKLGAWHKFDHEWAGLLSRSPGKPAYAHLIEMERKSAPFESWNTADIATFYKKGFRLVQRRALFGVSVTVSKADYAYYKATLPPRNTPDSFYGLCVRMVLDFIVNYFREGGEKHSPRVNCIFDQGKRTPEAAAIFNEMKRAYSDCSRILGDFASGSHRDHYGLQIADYFVARARRAEGSPALTEARTVRKPSETQERVAARGPAPLFHIDLHRDMLEAFKDEKPKVKSRLRRYKRLGLERPPGG